MRLESPLALAMTFALFACGGSGDKNTRDASLDASNEDASEGCASEADGTPCGIDQICLEGQCRPSICGDGFLDPARSEEECDDGNFVDGDGCDNDCAFSCHTDADCSDSDACTGIERCIEAGTGRRCQLGEPLDCAPMDASPCTLYLCDPVDGCDPDNFETILNCYADADGDGFPNPDVTSTFTVGEECECPGGFVRKRQDDLWDCNDQSPDAYPGQTDYFHVPHCSDGSPPASQGSAPCDGAPNAECAIYVCDDGTQNHSYDYDCDGELTREETATGVLCSGLSNCSLAGWQHDQIPPCGGSAPWTICRYQLVCVSNTVQRPQLCR